MRVCLCTKPHELWAVASINVRTNYCTTLFCVPCKHGASFCPSLSRSFHLDLRSRWPSLVLTTPLLCLVTLRGHEDTFKGPYSTPFKSTYNVSQGFWHQKNLCHNLAPQDHFPPSLWFLELNSLFCAEEHDILHSLFKRDSLNYCERC